MSKLENILRTFLNMGFIATLAIALSFQLNTAYAQSPFQYEISTGFFLSDDQDDNEVKMYSLQGRHHFSPVVTSGHPLKEAPFLERVGHFELIFALTDFSSNAMIGADGPLYGGSVIDMQPGFPLLLSTGFAKSDLEFDPPANADVSKDLYQLSIGFFVKDPLLVGLGYTRSETELSLSGLLSRTIQRDDYKLFTKWVHAIDLNTALNIEGTIETRQFDEDGNTGSNTLLDILAEYFFNPRTSLGIGLALNKGDDKEDEGATLTLVTTVFLNPSFFVQFGFDKFYADNNEGLDENNFDALLSARF